MKTHILAASLASLLVAAVLLTAIPSSDAAIDNDQGAVSYYTYTYDFAFKGTDAQSILWDFGFTDADGNRVQSTDWNPKGITFPAKGTYTITQTVSNTVGSYTSQVQLTVLGTPEVAFDSQGGSDVVTKIVKSGSLCPRPAEPVRDGYEFAGWYKDSQCTQAWNFSQDLVTQHTTLYAKWNTPGGEVQVVDPTPVPTATVNQDLILPGASIVIGLIAMIGAVSGKFGRTALYAGAALAAVGFIWMLNPGLFVQISDLFTGVRP